MFVILVSVDLGSKFLNFDNRRTMRLIVFPCILTVAVCAIAPFDSYPIFQ